MKPKLVIQDLNLKVHLGCTEEERNTPQEVLFSVQIEFSEPPPGEISDELGHTLCYADICQTIETRVSHRSFALVEKLGREAWQAIKDQQPNAAIQVSVHKLHPPVANLQGGVRYLTGDHIE